MKYIYINDLSYFIKNEKKFVITYLLFTIMYFTLNLTIFSAFKDKVVIETLALDCKFDLNDWLNLIAFILYILIHCYIGLKLFTKDFKNNPSNIFLRISYKKWILYKIFCIATISIILLFISYMLTIFLYFLLINGDIGIDVLIFIKNYVFILILQQLTLILYIIFSKYSFIILLIISSIVISIFNIPTNIISMNIYILLIIYVFVLFCILIINRKLYINLSESEE